MQDTGDFAFIGERRCPYQQVVQRAAQPIVVGAVVQRRRGAPGLLRRQVARRAAQLPFLQHDLCIHHQFGGVTELGQHDATVVRCREDICRLDVAMNQAASVDVCKRFGCTDGDIYRLLWTQGARRKVRAQCATADHLLDDKQRIFAMTDHFDTADYARAVQARQQRVFAFATRSPGFAGYPVVLLEYHREIV